MKKCIECEIIKNDKDFYKDSRAKDGLMGHCKACNTLRIKQGARVKVKSEKLTPTESSRRQRDSPAGQHRSNMYSMKCLYGINENQLQSLLLKQQGCCKICGADFGTIKLKSEKRPYAIDHCHTSKTVRGLLCLGCNITLGHIENNKINPEKFIEYIGEYL